MVIMTRSRRSSISVSLDGRDLKEFKLLELHEVCASGDEDQLQELLKTGKYDTLINYKDPDWGDRTALHWCCSKGRGEMARMLLEKGAHPGLRSDCGWTPAHFAAEVGKTHVLRLLHNSNAPMNREDLFGDTPRAIASIYGHKDSVEFLKTAEVEYTDRRIRMITSGDSGQYDDEDIEWCIQNNILSKSDVFSISDTSSVRDSTTSETKRKRRSSANSSGKKTSISTRSSKTNNRRQKTKPSLVESLHSIRESH